MATHLSTQEGIITNFRNSDYVRQQEREALHQQDLQLPENKLGEILAREFTTNQHLLLMSMLSQLSQREVPVSSGPFHQEMVNGNNRTVRIQATSGSEMRMSPTRWSEIEKLSQIYAEIFNNEWGEKLSPEDFSLWIWTLGDHDIVSIAKDNNDLLGAAVSISASSSTVIDQMKQSIRTTMGIDIPFDEESRLASVLGESWTVYFAEIFVTKPGRQVSPLVFTNLIYTSMRTLLEQGVSPNTKVVFFTKGQDNTGRTPAIYYFAKFLRMEKIPLASINQEGRYAFVISLGKLTKATSPTYARTIILASRFLKKIKNTFIKPSNNGKES